MKICFNTHNRYSYYDLIKGTLYLVVDNAGDSTFPVNDAIVMKIIFDKLVVIRSQEILCFNDNERDLGKITKGQFVKYEGEIKLSN